MLHDGVQFSQLEWFDQIAGWIFEQRSPGQTFVIIARDENEGEIGLETVDCAGEIGRASCRERV